MMIWEIGAWNTRWISRWAAPAFWRCDSGPTPIGSDAVNGKEPREHLVERDARRVQIAARIDRAVHSPRLLRGHVGQRSGYELGRFRRLALARKARSNPKAHEPDLERLGIHQNVCRLYILVNQIPFVQFAERPRETDGEASTASSPSALEGIDQEFHRQGLRAQGWFAHVARRGPWAEPQLVHLVPQRVFVFERS